MPLGIPSGNEATLTRDVRNRQAAYTTLFRAWARVQNVVAFVRYDQGDADKLAPTLFVRIPGSAKKTVTAKPGAPVVASSEGPAVAVPASTGDAKVLQKLIHGVGY